MEVFSVGRVTVYRVLNRTATTHAGLSGVVAGCLAVRVVF